MRNGLGSGQFFAFAPGLVVDLEAGSKGLEVGRLGCLWARQQRETETAQKERPPAITEESWGLGTTIDPYPQNPQRP